MAIYPGPFGHVEIPVVDGRRPKRPWHEDVRIRRALRREIIEERTR